MLNASAPGPCRYRLACSTSIWLASEIVLHDKLPRSTVLPLSAHATTLRNVPAPLSAQLVTTRLAQVAAASVAAMPSALAKHVASAVLCRNEGKPLREVDMSVLGNRRQLQLHQMPPRLQTERGICNHPSAAEHIAEQYVGFLRADVDVLALY